ncbi:xanthine dehydrogenase family protein subunit M [soil metagenome]
MKPAAFTHHAPESVDDALGALAEAGHDGKVLAGGQSLVPILNMRLAAPAHLIDINRLSSLATVHSDSAGVRVGATARQADVQADEGAYAVQPLLRRALRLVAHPAIRNRGTICGSLAHADPAGELTAVLSLTGGSVRLNELGSGERDVAAADFFLGPLESSLVSGELMTSAFFPAFEPGTGSAFVEVARRHGDYALCGVAAAVAVDPGGQITRARAAYLSVAPIPLVLDLTEAVGGQPAGSADWSAAADQATAQVEPEADIHATAAYRRRLVGVLTARAGADAARDALGAGR